MIKLVLMFICFFIGYFIADLEIIDIPFNEMPYFEDLYEQAE
tara:strand:+ start:1953 stop:2078 length:126 start_codon:yes stop_codon:yes gene_type:complete